jgi:hypothetical protein
MLSKSQKPQARDDDHGPGKTSRKRFEGRREEQSITVRAPKGRKKIEKP